jgi:iron-sulfur cluster repair protein YtfE (RIC family)
MPNRIDSIIAKGKGTVTAAKARLRGMVGVFKVLSEQHGEVVALLKRVKRDPTKRAELWPKLRKELVSHENGELRELYPVLRQHDQTRALADRHEAEAGQLSVLIDRIHAAEMSSAEWGALFDQLAEQVEQHVKEEETEFFPRAQEVIGHARAKEIEPRFLAVKKQLAMAL